MNSNFSETATPLAALQSRRSVLGPAYRLFYDEPLMPVRGEGVWLFDASGRRYLDAYNNVPVVGHAHPRVVDAIARQAATLNTHTRYLHPRVIEYAERLLSHYPAPLDRAMFTCTGSEANDLALRMARAVTGGTGVVVTAHAYHGVTALLAEMSPSLAPIGPHVRTISPPIARPGEDNDALAARFCADVRSAFTALRDSGFQAAALLVDTSFASDGIAVPPAGVLEGAATAARAAGALYIADEVQAGFGRLGPQWWGWRSSGAVPDLVTMGKPMGNGHPIGGVVTTSAIAQAFADRGRYFNTFGGNPVSAAAGLAVLDVLEDEGLPEQAAHVGRELGEALRARIAPLAGGVVRGQGLYWGVELVTMCGTDAGERARHAVNAMRKQGVLIGSCGSAGEVLKIRPPLQFSSAHVMQLVEALEVSMT
ncbi:MAG: aminotransferase class III-fold pyridoxal phosphate-dependent enzyme [Xenophilus sp.]